MSNFDTFHMSDEEIKNSKKRIKSTAGKIVKDVLLTLGATALFYTVGTVPEFLPNASLSFKTILASVGAIGTLKGCLDFSKHMNYALYGTGKDPNSTKKNHNKRRKR